MDTLQLDPSLNVGRQPTEDEIIALSELGFKTIINLRTEGDDGQSMSPEEERHVAEQHSLIYHHIPVDPDKLREDDVDEFREVFDEAEKPVYVHCSTGKRAGAFAVMHVAVQKGLTGEETVRKAERLGFKCDSSELKKFVANYVDHQTAAIH